MSEKNIDYLSQNAFSKLASQKKYQIVTGLDNFEGELANTCFMNSVIQVLLNIPELTLYFLSKQYDKDKKVSDGMADAYRDLLLNINNPKARYESLVKINRAFAKVCKSYKIGSQYDAHLFLLYFLNYVSKEVNDPKFNKDKFKILREKLEKESDIDKKVELRKQISESEINLFLLRLLYFQNLETRYCSQCNSCFFNSVQQNNFIKGDFGSLENLIKSIYKDKLVNEGKSKEFCKTCNKEVLVNFETRIYGAPNYFFVRREKYGEHEKFSFVGDDFSIGELAAKKEDQDVKYELTSIICRSGYSADSGHCYSCCYKFNNVWYYFSDNTLKKMPDDYKIDQDEDIQKNFFLGIYRKKDMRDKDLFDGYDINDFVHDEEDLKIISELDKKEKIEEPVLDKTERNEETKKDEKQKNGSKEKEAKKESEKEEIKSIALKKDEEQGKKIINSVDQKIEQIEEKPNTKDNISEEERKEELDYDLNKLLEMSIDKLESNLIKVKDKKAIFDESKKRLNEVFENNKSNRVIFKNFGNTKENIDNNLDKIKKELVIFIICSNMAQDVKSNYIKLVKNANKISVLRRIWQTIKNIIKFRFSEVGKAKQSTVFERISDIKDRIDIKNSVTR